MSYDKCNDCFYKDTCEWRHQDNPDEEAMRDWGCPAVQEPEK